MIYWFLFILSSLILLYFSTCNRYSANSRRYFKFFFIAELICFSTFRDGLGQDYDGYLELISYMGNLNSDLDFFSLIIKEPLFFFISKLINRTVFSPLLFFLISSCVIIYGITEFYFRNDKFIFLSVAFFLLFPSLFFNSFNAVRQFFSISIFVYSLKYVEQRKFWKYMVCIFVAFLMHYSSIILLPLYFLLNRRMSNKTLIIVACIMIFFRDFISNILRLVINFSTYSYYLDTDLKIQAQSVLILLNILLILLILKRENESKQVVIVENCFFLYVIFMNLSVINIMFIRLSIFFLPSLAFIMPYILCRYCNEKIVTPLFLVVWLLVFVAFLTGNIDNPKVVPRSMLSIDALFD